MILGGDTQKLFQYGVVAVFIGFAVLGTLFLASHRSNNATNTEQPITIWGPPIFTEDGRTVFSDLDDGQGSMFSNITYVTKHPDTLYPDLVEAMATDRSPDIVLFDAGMLLSLRDKLYRISYETYPIRDFRDAFVEGAEVFAMRDGIYGFPLLVDPLVLFWNRNAFTDAAVPQVPKDWDTFVATVPRLTRVTEGADVLRSGVAFGEYDNVLHAKEILSTLIMQTGNAIVEETDEGYVSVLENDTAPKTAVSPALALRFYTDFSNPIKTVYSWNKTFPVSRDAFVAGDVAMYIGFASEAALLAEMNPNLNFDVALLPQSATGANQATYGMFYGAGVVQTSKYPERAFQIAQELTTPTTAAYLAERSAFSAVRRDMLVADPADPYSENVVRSVIIARTWLEPRLSGVTGEYIGSAINAVVSGRLTPDAAIQKLHRDMSVLLQSYTQ